MSDSQHQKGASSKRLSISPLNSDLPEQVVVVENRASVGSHESCSVVLTSEQSEPLSCLIIQGTEGTIVRSFHEDTKLNGESFGDAWIHPGDTISIGNIDLRLECEALGEFQEMSSKETSMTDHKQLIQDAGQTDRSTESNEVEDRTQQVLDLIERLGNLENQLEQLKESNSSLSEKATSLEQQNVELKDRLESAKQDRSSEHPVEPVNQFDATNFASNPAPPQPEFRSEENPFEAGANPFEAIEQIDAARQAEIQPENSVPNENSTLSVPAVADNQVVEDEQSEPNSWEAEIRKEFFDELKEFEQLEDLSTNQVSNETADLDQNDPEDSNSAIAQAFPELDRFTPPSGESESTTENEPPRDEQSTQIESEEIESNTIEPNTIEKSIEPELAQQLEQQVEPAQPTEEVNESSDAESLDPMDSAETSDTGEIDFDFALAESNFAGAFGDLEEDSPESDSFEADSPSANETNQSEQELNYTESTGSTESSDDQLDSQAESFFAAVNAAELDSPFSEYEDESNAASEPAIEEPALENSLQDEVVENPEADQLDLQAESFFEAVNAAELDNPYSEFEDEPTADPEPAFEENSLENSLADGVDESPTADQTETDAVEEENTFSLLSQFEELAGQTFDENQPSPAETEQPAESSLANESDYRIETALSGFEDANQTAESPSEFSSSIDNSTFTPLQPLEETTAEKPANNENSSGDSEDSYIQEYMKKLLGNSEEVQPAVEPEEPEEEKTESPSLLEKTFEAEIKERQELLKPSEFVPKSSAPEKNSNLEAMRELANQSARSAIETSTRKRRFEQQSMFVLIGAGVCFFIGASLAMLSSSILSFTAFGSAIFFAATGFGAWYYFDMKNSAEGNNDDSPEEKAEPAAEDVQLTPLDDVEIPQG